MTEPPPRPYVPPESAAPRIPGAKPWMVLPDATQRCWRCGVLIVDPTALTEHEDDCKG